jgi:acyl-coenzyme A thioesterase PaaI-like protein
MKRAPPAGFAPLATVSPFVNRAGEFFIRPEEDGSQTVGTWIGPDQANSEGFVHGGFLLTFADFAMTTVTAGITLNLSADFLRPARIGDWIEARIIVRKASDTLIFADAIATGGDRAVLRVSGLFLPFRKRAPRTSG